jgi:hypothetical protein
VLHLDYGFYFSAIDICNGKCVIGADGFGEQDVGGVGEWVWGGGEGCGGAEVYFAFLGAGGGEEKDEDEQFFH